MLPDRFTARASYATLTAFGTIPVEVVLFDDVYQRLHYNLAYSHPAHRAP